MALLAVIVVNSLVNTLPINGQTTGAIADRFPVYFLPAGYVFSIWGLIYVALIGFVVYQALPSRRDNHRLRAIDFPFLLSCIANIAWIFAWHYEIFPLTLVIMGVLLVSLIAIYLYLRLDIGRGRVSTGERWLVHIPFSINLGWITVATVANVTSLLYYLRWDGWGVSPVAWAAIMLIVTATLAGAMSLTRRDVAYLLVIVWAFVGIAVRQSGTQPVAWATWALAAVVAALAVLSLASRLGWMSRPTPSGSR